MRGVDYGACSLTCGLGKRVRKRPCDNPKPQYGGRPCNATGTETDFKYCREQRCREIGLFMFSNISIF